MSKIGDDLACYNLARYFLSDAEIEHPLGDEEAENNRASLSKTIQVAVEDWFASQNWEPHG